MSFNLINIGLWNKWVTINNCNEDLIHIDILFNQLRHHISGTEVNITDFRFRLSLLELMYCIINKFKFGVILFQQPLSFFLAIHLVFFHRQKNKIIHGTCMSFKKIKCISEHFNIFIIIRNNKNMTYFLRTAISLFHMFFKQLNSFSVS